MVHYDAILNYILELQRNVENKDNKWCILTFLRPKLDDFYDTLRSASDRGKYGKTCKIILIFDLKNVLYLHAPSH